MTTKFWIRTFMVMAAVVALFATEAAATRTPGQSVGLSASFRVQMQQLADASNDTEIDAAIARALQVMETEQPALSKTLKKNANEIKILERALKDDPTYEEQVEILINLYSLVTGTCGLEANAAILAGRGSIISKAKKAAKMSKITTKATTFAADLTKPRHKRMKKLASAVKKAEKAIKKATK